MFPYPLDKALLKTVLAMETLLNLPRGPIIELASFPRSFTPKVGKMIAAEEKHKKWCLKMR